MNQYARERQDKIHRLLDSDSLTLDTARAALRSLLDVTSSAQTGPDVTSYGIDGSLSQEVVDAEYAGRDEVGDDVDSTLLRALESPHRSEGFT
ncbi:hypothetical protein [Streptomyces sp. NBC_01601]|uniref:hypothetical protein n=1 Tax=Streptomyces sp. NBC_01601 TaxID=2975892 RepID=UPI002E2C0889|nr:hypothetical protein [Streptomyces sp. NBC_01601]